MVKKKVRLPNEIIVFKNKDKESFQEKWTENRNPANIPHSFRAVFIAKPSSGKTNYIFNLLLRQKPPFERIMIWTQSQHSREYEDLDVEYFDHCPTEEELLEEIDPKTHQPPKQVLIVEDCELENLPKEEKSQLLRILKHYSSHFNTSVIMTVHDLIQIPASMRRTCNVFVLWKLTNGTMKILGDRFNIDNKILYNMCTKHLNNQHDSIMIDLTANSPYKFRKNLFEILDENEFKENKDKISKNDLEYSRNHILELPFINFDEKNNLS